MFLRNTGIIILCLITVYCQSQEKQKNALRVGDRVPEHILKMLPQKKDTRLFILDFWATSCSNCMDAFPKMEKLQNTFPSALQVVLVNSWEDEKTIQQRLSKINSGRRQENQPPIIRPSVKAINNDKTLIELFPANNIPQHVWITGNGVVYAITPGHNATAEHIEAVLQGQKIEFSLKDDVMGADIQKNGVLRPGNPALSAIYYAGFTRYFSSVVSFSEALDSTKGLFRYSFYNWDVIDHYRNAFRGNSKEQRILLLVKNRKQYSRPKDDNLIDRWNREYVFTYEIQYPLNAKAAWRSIMQQDVNRFFGSMFGIEGRVEKINYNSLILVKTRAGALTTSGEKRSFQNMDTLLSMTNSSFKSFLHAISRKLENMDAGQPFIDETGIPDTLKADIQLTGDLKNVQQVRKQLEKYGLDIIQAQREVEVLVIKDKAML